MRETVAANKRVAVLEARCDAILRAVLVTTQRDPNRRVCDFDVTPR